ncbi:nucleotidyltransferase [Bacillus sp. HMF5848]|uniref:DUF294 nucleotidyltransferase-like domain-containing protein n=1 Tax=Bacillus sp. HMF5848 TaxID=2495421 RepID=UPI000F77C6AE|nr:DUF294 nucleotidyltransferase-like domain-containing protein [Bacillus sp. HMF5848]RSK26270.1 nucleotidyltransferase [Bacillus sp. HMF5848]
MNELLHLQDKIEQANSISMLRELHDEILMILKGHPDFLSLNRDVTFSVYKQLSIVHDALMYRVLKLAEIEVELRGIGQRPDAYCWYIMGSGARHEQTVRTDQDNGIIFDCNEGNKESCYQYINELAKIGTSYMNDIGYPFCEGHVMATNPRWQKQLADWERQIKQYVEGHTPDDIRYLLIASDLRAIYGDPRLIVVCKRNLQRLLYSSAMTLKRMGEHCLTPEVPLSFFGYIHAERWGEHAGKLNIKQAIYVPIINCIKFLCAIYHVDKDSTWERAYTLFAKNHLPHALYEDICIALQTALYLRLLYSVKEQSSADYVCLRDLHEQDRALLKEGLKTAKVLQRYVNKLVVNAQYEATNL